jgi:penicillin-binding protein 2
VAMASYPSYDPEVMADGDDIELIESYNNDARRPFLNKVLGGVYTPGSVVKPFLVYAALSEGVIVPSTEIVSTGEIVIPNPYTPSQPARFTDWRPHGKMDALEAIAFSSNVYMYYISGGYGDQRGIGITKMNEYYDLFGFGQSTDMALLGEQVGTVPSPAWKEETFNDDWRLGDTYNTSIGQFGWQVPPIQFLRAYGALATGGTMWSPHITKGAVGKSTQIDLDEDLVQVIHKAMHMTTNYPGGTARGLEKKYVNVAAKSGTAEVGSGNQFVNSWAAGWWPIEEPRYVFILMMERAPRSNTLGATTIMGQIVDWIHDHKPEYLSVALEEQE